MPKPIIKVRVNNAIEAVSQGEAVGLHFAQAIPKMPNLKSQAKEFCEASADANDDNIRREFKDRTAGVKLEEDDFEDGLEHFTKKWVDGCTDGVVKLLQR